MIDMEQQTVFRNSLVTANYSLYSLIASLKEKLLNIVKMSSHIRIKGFDIKKGIVITTNHNGNECLEIDVDNMQLNKFYMGAYMGDTYLFRKTSKNILETYEVE